MSTPNDTIRKMLLAQLADDSTAFRAAVVEFIAEERRKSHHVIARDLDRLLNGGGQVRRIQPLRSLFAWENEVPRDGDRGLPLLHVREPAAELEGLVLAPQVRASLELFVRENANADLLRLHGAPPPTRLLLCGPPGCGKTTAAEAIATALRLPFALVRFDVLVSSYLGETSANLRRIFDFVTSREMVVLFDEFDGIGKRRDDDMDHGELRRVVNAFLQMLDAFRSSSILVAATNHEGLLDPALWRRFDEIVLLGKPDEQERIAVLQQALRQIGVEPGVDWAALSTLTVDMAHADVERVATLAIRDTILKGRTRVSGTTLHASAARCRERQELQRRTTSCGIQTALGVSDTAARRDPDAVRSDRTPVSPHSAVPESTPGQPGAEAPRKGRRRSKPRNTGAVRPRDREEGGRAGEDDRPAVEDVGHQSVARPAT